MPTLRAVGIGLWVIGLLAAVVELVLAAHGLVVGVAVYGAWVVQVAVFLRRVGDYGWPTAVLYPIPLLACLATLAWSLVPRATRAR
jgi:hypothetical protein